MCAFTDLAAKLIANPSNPLTPFAPFGYSAPYFPAVVNSTEMPGGTAMEIHRLVTSGWDTDIGLARLFAALGDGILEVYVAFRYWSHAESGVLQH